MNVLNNPTVVAIIVVALWMLPGIFEFRDIMKNKFGKRWVWFLFLLAGPFGIPAYLKYHDDELKKKDDE